jgi:hypothetical protein
MRSVNATAIRLGQKRPTPLADLVGPAMPSIESFELRRTGS